MSSKGVSGDLSCASWDPKKWRLMEVLATYGVATYGKGWCISQMPNLVTN